MSHGEPPRFDTVVVHAGVEPDPIHGAIMPPIVQSSTYVQKAPGQHTGYEYSRTGNPTRTALETCLAALEGGAAARAFGSGCAATAAVLHTLKAGDHVVTGTDLYGGTYRLFTKAFAQLGIRFSFVDTTDLEATRAACAEGAALLWVETPTNPLLRISDVGALAEIAAGCGAKLAVDNTFASPVLQRPLASGAHYVVHSMTKYLGGHSDVVGGCVVSATAELDERIGFFQNTVGAVPGPMDCFLVHRGIKTLALRMARHCSTAAMLADWLAAHPAVSRVLYPGLADHPGHEIARRQMCGGFGGMLAFELDRDLEASVRFVSSTELFALAESLGGVESLIEHPASMTHASVPAELRAKEGLTDGLIRLSVGIEDPADLKADLERGFAAAG